MVFDSPKQRTGGEDALLSPKQRTGGEDALLLEGRAGLHSELMPMQIAHHALLTAREKLELLNRLKAEVTGALENSQDLGFSLGEIDQAIDEVKLDVENGIGEETILREDKDGND